MKKVLILLAALLPSLLFAQAKTGTAEGQFLEIGVGARATGMGEAFTATANDLSAIYYNPGYLGEMTRKEAMFSHIAYFAGISYDYGAFAMPIDMTGGVAALSVASLYSGEMYETTPTHPEGTGRTFGVHDYNIGLSYGQMLTDRFSAGLTWKFIGERYHDVSAYSWAVDIGTIYHTEFKNFRIGMTISNFGPDITFIQDPAALPMAFHLGFAGDPIDTDVHKLTVAFDLAHPNDNLEKFSFGTEYWWNNMVALRAGVQTQQDFPDSWAEIPGVGLDIRYYSFGAGAKIPIYLYTLKVDYSFNDRHWLDPEHRFTIGMEF